MLDAVIGTIRGSFYPSLAEALSIREALSWMHSLAYSDIVIESNALVVIEALNNPISDNSSLGLIVDNRKLLARNFSSSQFVFIYRSANQVVNALAGEAVSTSGLLGKVILSPTLIQL